MLPTKKNIKYFQCPNSNKFPSDGGKEWIPEILIAK